MSNFTMKVSNEVGNAIRMMVDAETMNETDFDRYSIERQKETRALAGFLEECAKERKRIKRRRAKGLEDYTGKQADLIRRNEAENKNLDRAWNTD